MGKPIRGPYDPAFRARAVELVCTSGLSKAQVARDLGINLETLRLWVKQAGINAGQRNRLTTAEKAGLARLRREVVVLKEERESLSKPRLFSPGRVRRDELLRVHRGQDGLAPGRALLPGGGRLPVRLLCLARAGTLGPRGLTRR